MERTTFRVVSPSLEDTRRYFNRPIVPPARTSAPLCHLPSRRIVLACIMTLRSLLFGTPHERVQSPLTCGWVHREVMHPAVQAWTLAG